MSSWFVFRREIRALAYSPQTYAIGAAYLILSGIFFVNILISSEIPDLERYYSNIASTLLVLVPVVAMRSFAEERRTGALDITLAWPVSRTGLVLGKFAANSLYLWLLSSVVWLYYRLVGSVASIAIGRTAGGYFGLLLMAMAFSALALMVSSQASSPTAAAFLGFGLLLFLWILDYAPGWIGDWLKGLGPSKHFASFPRGVVYWEDVAYFVLAALIGVGLAIAALERDRPGRALGSLLRRGAALGFVMVLWGGTAALAGHIEGQVDLTPTKENTTTQTTRDVIHQIRKLGEPIRLTGFAEPISREAAKLDALVKQFRNAGARIKLTIVDPDVQPGRARELGISSYGDALVELGAKHEILSDTSQGGLTSALLRLARTTKPSLCFTAGHGERDITDETEVGLSTLARTLRFVRYEIRRLALAAPGAQAELERCAAVIIAGPRIPFLAGELELLRGHAAADGRLLVMADGSVDAPTEQLNTLLAPWGVTLEKGIVRDASALAGDPSSIVSLDFGAGSSPPVRGLQLQEIPVVLTNALPLQHTAEADEQGAVSDLVRSSTKSWIAKPPPDGKVERQGPFVLAAMADWSRVEGSEDNPAIARTRIGVVGSAEMATNRIIDILGNREFSSALVQWIAHEDDVITAGRPASGFNKLVLTTHQKGRLIREGIVFPALALLIPLPFTALRLRRG